MENAETLYKVQENASCFEVVLTSAVTFPNSAGTLGGFDSDAEG